jgi:hypothetical protein
MQSEGQPPPPKKNSGCPYGQVAFLDFLTLKMEALRLSETSELLVQPFCATSHATLLQVFIFNVIGFLVREFFLSRSSNYCHRAPQ